MGFDQLPIVAQFIVSALVAVGAFLAGKRGYQNTSAPAQDLHVAGALVSSSDLKPLTEALLRLAAAVEVRSEQWEERAEQERAEAIERKHQEEVAQLLRKVESLEQRLRNP